MKETLSICPKELSNLQASSLNSKRPYFPHQVSVEQYIQKEVLDPEEAYHILAGVTEGWVDIQNVTNPHFRKEFREDIATASHEIVHGVAARSVGDNVVETSIQASGSIKGYMKSIPRYCLDPLESMRNFIVKAMGGKVGEELVGHHDHSGCGSDIARASMCARVLSRFSGDSVRDILMWGVSSARQAVMNEGFHSVRTQTSRLLKMRTI